ncbi:MAG: type II secretion system protein [Rubrivivax sp.]|nr:MAG: type II secretion system protein [Rubrivivax sp.]
MIPQRPPRGFTLVELVMVIVIVGILAVTVMPKMLDLTMWRLKAFGDEFVAQTLSMERLALAQRRAILATIAPTGITFTYVSGGATIASVPCPTTITSCISEATRTVTFNTGNSGSAATSTGSAITVTVASGSYSQAYKIETETGLIYPSP